MLRNIKYILILGALCVLLSPDLMAQQVDIPLAEKMADETESKGIFELGSWLLKGMAGLIFTGLSLYAIVTTGNAAIVAFNDWRTGRAEFGEMASKVGISLLVMAVVLMLAYVGVESI